MENGRCKRESNAGGNHKCAEAEELNPACKPCEFYIQLTRGEERKYELELAEYANWKPQKCCVDEKSNSTVRSDVSLLRAESWDITNGQNKADALTK